MFHNFFKMVFAVLISLAGMTVVFAQNGNTVLPADRDNAETSRSRLFAFDNGWWRINESGRKEAKVSQCGFYSSIFVLEFFDRIFNPVLVSENLPASECGVSLDTIQKLLQAHGLKTTGRKNVTFADLKRIFKDTVAIVAIPNPQDAAHYFVAAPTPNATEASTAF